MATGLSPYLANKWLSAVFKNTSYSTTCYMQVHTGSPGASGTANVASITSRKVVAWSAAVTGAKKNSSPVAFDTTAAETPTHYSLWDAATSGNFLLSGTLTSGAYAAYNTFIVPTGGVDVSLTTATTGVRSVSVALANSLLDTLGGTAYSITGPYVQLHNGDPGATGTSNPAYETARKQPTYGTATGGAIQNSAPVVWPTIAGSGQPPYFTVWTTTSGGTFLLSGALSTLAYDPGDNLSIAAGALQHAFALAS